MITPSSRLEERVGALISAYADRAPIDVDPMAMSRLAAASATRRGPWASFTLADRGLALIIVVIATLVAIVAGALAVGAELRRDRSEELLGHRVLVEPFIGLPPEDALPSSPKTGELVLNFVARVLDLGYDVHAMSLYADGRLIWRRNLEGNSDSKRVFGASEPTTAVIEQRLTPEGVELIREAVRADTETPATGSSGVVWGEMRVRQEDELRYVSWSDWRLPGRLADPGSWLPASAWVDQRIRPYVARSYVICSDPGLNLVPEPVRSRVFANAKEMTASWMSPRSCYLVSTEVARDVARSLVAAGVRLDGLYSGYSSDDRIDIFPATPDGEAICLACG